MELVGGSLHASPMDAGNASSPQLDSGSDRHGLWADKVVPAPTSTQDPIVLGRQHSVRDVSSDEDRAQTLSTIQVMND